MDDAEDAKAGWVTGQHERPARSGGPPVFRALPRADCFAWGVDARPALASVPEPGIFYVGARLGSFSAGFRRMPSWCRKSVIL
jgi:hypothetical protein